MTRARLALRIHRFEAVALALVAVGAFAFAGGLWLRMLAFGLPASCLVFDDTGQFGCPARVQDVSDYQFLAGDFGMFGALAIAILPFVLGTILGVALVAKELERGTVALAWSISPSRRRWLLGVVVPAVLAVVGVSVVAGLLADRLEFARDPSIDPSLTLHHLGLRGVVLPAYALISFGIALAVGARLGRVMPALLLAAVLSMGAAFATNAIVGRILQSEHVTIEASAMVRNNVLSTGSLIDSRIRTPEGDLIPWGLAYERYETKLMPDSPSYDPAYQEVYLVTPGQVYPIAEWRMAVILGALGLAGMVAAAAIVERRRPT
jgi:ABC-type transport system involved in multi-copper enzyme maturation permease subunit